MKLSTESMTTFLAVLASGAMTVSGLPIASPYENKCPCDHSEHDKQIKNCAEVLIDHDAT
jgi:hypothetical protein